MENLLFHLKFQMSVFYAKFLAKLPTRDREKQIVSSLHHFNISSLIDHRNISINEHVRNGSLVVKYGTNNYLAVKTLINVISFAGVVSI